MLPWDKIIVLQKKSPVPVYLQISNAFVIAIKGGLLRPGSRMPGSRFLADTLKVHRKTIVAAYAELNAQGWIYSGSTKGTFVSNHLPEIEPKKLTGTLPVKSPSMDTTGYAIKFESELKPSYVVSRNLLGFHIGPDMRLVPTEELAKAYKSVMTRKSLILNLSYVDPAGNIDLRKQLSEHLNTSRGLHTTEENIFVSRGSQMAIYMLTRLLIASGDNVIVGNPDFYYVIETYKYIGANLIKVNVDENGIDVDQVEEVCRKTKIRAMYVTSHHHYPTTVTLSASRRMRLLALAEKYGFIIIEDDYDYDFHYESSPILPLASADKSNMVIYIGGLSKTVAPALRIGYVAAPRNLIIELCRLRQIIDIQGDSTLEKAIAEMFAQGEMRRHMKKSLKEYHIRRDFICGLMKDKLGDVINFRIPDGGLSIWAQFDKSVPLLDLSEKFRKRGYVISNGKIHDHGGKRWNSCIMGFGMLNTDEAEEAVMALHSTVKKK